MSNKDTCIVFVSRTTLPVDLVMIGWSMTLKVTESKLQYLAYLVIRRFILSSDMRSMGCVLIEHKGIRRLLSWSNASIHTLVVCPLYFDMLCRGSDICMCLIFLYSMSPMRNMR